MADKVRETVVEEVSRVTTLTQDAARSGAYLYPIKVSHSTRHGDEKADVLGHCVLSNTSRLVAAIDVETDTDRYSRTRHHYLHVCCCIRSSSRCAIDSQWPACNLYHDITGPE
jgi:hypothetical protein